MASIHALFRQLRQVGASDLHLVAGRPPMLRTSGHISEMNGQPELSDAALREMLSEIVSDRQWRRFERDHDLDFATAVEGVARFRGNYFEQQHGVGAVFRMVPDKIIEIENLGLPQIVHGLSDLESGMVLVTGPTGSGKSTTLAAIIDLINRKHARHIVTIEDPVEFVHQNKRSVISHREVGTDSDDFAAALRAALRQDADVVLVGEMRDYETISLAVEAASMGVLVFGTLHTSSAAKTVDRIIDSFPADQQDRARGALAESLSAVVSQILCKKKESGRVGAHEILIRTPGLAGAIREGNSAMLNSMIGAGRGFGMQTMDGALMELVQAGVIDGHEAYLKASDKKIFHKWAESGA
jgi:twitching motility protein PilT